MSPLRGCIVLATTLTLLAIAGRAVAATDYLYALVDVTGSSNRLYGFQVDATTGALTLLPGFPFNTDSNGDVYFGTERLAYDAVQNRLYVVNDRPVGPGLGDYVSARSVNLATGEFDARVRPQLASRGMGLPEGASQRVTAGGGGREREAGQLRRRLRRAV